MLRNSMVYRLTAGYVMIVLISMLIVGIFFIKIFRDYTFENKQKSMMTRAKEIAKATEPFLSKNIDINEYGSFINTLDSFVGARVWIVDRDGNIVVMSKARERAVKSDLSCDNTDIGMDIIGTALNGEEIIKEGNSNYYNQPMLVVGVPVYNGSKTVVGAVFLHSPITGITSTIDKAFTILIIALLMAIFLTAVMSFYFSKLITKPLRLMNQSAIEMTKGNYSVRTNIHQKDEVGQLSNSLDLLASKLGYTIDQLFQERNKLKDLLASISEGILAFDMKMKLINYNEALKQVLGYSYSDNIEDRVKTDLQKHNLLNEFTAVIESGDSSTTIREWNGKKLKFFLSPVKNSSNKIIGVVSLVQDVSEHERLEQMRKDFIANVSHELRTPLTLVRGYMEALIDGAISREEDVQKYYKKVLQEAKGLERLVRDLLDLSKLQSGKINLQVEDIDIVSLLTDVSRSMQTIANMKGISIELDIKEKENVPAVIGDYDRLRQLFIIFLDNAIKYSFNNTRINISLEVKDYVYVKIMDEGVGIPKEDIPYIWERFYKVDKSRRQSDSGTGLGLAIAKYLVEMHKGIVKLESELNKGTEVEVGLPFIK